jgi:hypothetical protein
MRKGAIIGGGFIAAIYGLGYLVQVGTDRARRDNCIHTPEFCALIEKREPELPYLVPALVGGTIGGAAIGFGMGSREREVWQEVRPRSLRPVPAPSGLSVSVSLHF